MKQKLKLFVWLIPILLFCLYWLGIYLSLKNPMEEIVYSENGGLMRYVMFKPYTETIGSDRIWKAVSFYKNFLPTAKTVLG